MGCIQKFISCVFNMLLPNEFAVALYSQIFCVVGLVGVVIIEFLGYLF